MCSALPEKSNLYPNSFLSDGLGVAQKPRFGRAVVTYGACEWTEEKWITLQEKLESACMDNLLLSSPPDCVKASRSGLPVSKVPNATSVKREKRNLASPRANRGPRFKGLEVRCELDNKKKTNNKIYKDLLEEFQSKCTVCSPARLFQGWGKLSFRLTYTTPERHFEPTETQLRGNRR